jgi:hypothetical protein
MGMDLSGARPNTKNGKYFRSDSWHWGPLWNYVAGLCADVLTPDEIQRGHFNDHLRVKAGKSRAIGLRLVDEITSGRTQAYEKRFKRKKNAGARLPSVLMASTVVKALGETPGKAEFNLRHVGDFAVFCVSCGGFWID